MLVWFVTFSSPNLQAGSSQGIWQNSPVVAWLAERSKQQEIKSSRQKQQPRVMGVWLGNSMGSRGMISLCQTAELLEVMRFFYCTNLQCNVLTFSPCCTENI